MKTERGKKADDPLIERIISETEGFSECGEINAYLDSLAAENPLFEKLCGNEYKYRDYYFLVGLCFIHYGSLRVLALLNNNRAANNKVEIQAKAASQAAVSKAKVENNKVVNKAKVSNKVEKIHLVETNKAKVNNKVTITHLVAMITHLVETENQVVKNQPKQSLQKQLHLA